MSDLLALLVGVLITLLLAWNGQLAAEAGDWGATLLIHIVGLAVILPIWLLSRLRARRRPAFVPAVGPLPWYYGIAGVTGVIVVVGMNYSFATSASRRSMP